MPKNAIEVHMSTWVENSGEGDDATQDIDLKFTDTIILTKSSFIVISCFYNGSTSHAC